VRPFITPGVWTTRLHIAAVSPTDSHRDFLLWLVATGSVSDFPGEPDRKTKFRRTDAVDGEPLGLVAERAVAEAEAGGNWRDDSGRWHIPVHGA
jgi:hypothetical protein